MKFGETLQQRSVPKWASYNLNYNELKRLIKLRTTNGAPSPVPIPGQTDHRWSLLEDELYGVLKDQHDNIALFLRSKYGEIERRLAYLDKSVRSAKRSANLYSGRPSLQARKYQKLVQEAEAIGEDIQALSRFAAVQKTGFRKISKKYRKWTNSSALQERLVADVFSTNQLDLNLSDQMQHLSAQTAIIKNLEDELLYPDQQGPDRRTSTIQLESPVTQITKAAQLGPLNFDAAVASVPFGESSGTAAYWIHMDNLEEARVLLLRYMRDLDLPNTLSRESSSDTLTNTSFASRPETPTRACYFDNMYRFAQDTTTHAPSKIAMCARWSHSKQALVTLADMSPRSDTSSTIPVKRKDLSIALDREQDMPKERSANAANINVVKDFLSQHRDVRALAEQGSTRTRLSGLNNSSEVGTFAVLDSNISFGPLVLKEILESERNSANNHAFPHAVLQIRWEFGRKPEVVRAFDTTHLAERVADFSLEAAAIQSQYPDHFKPSWTLMLMKDIRKVPVQARTSKRQDVVTGTPSGPSSTGESVFSVKFDQSAGSETSPVASTRDMPLDRSSSVPVKKPKKKARIAAESPSRQQARYYSEYDDPNSELNQEETYTIYVDPNAEAPGVETLRKIGASFSKTFGYIWPGSKAESDERAPLLENRSSTDEDQSSGSESEVTPGVPKHRGLKGRIRPAERYRLRLSRRQRAFERTLQQMYFGLIILSYIFLLLSAILLTTGRKKEVVEVDVGATVGLIVSLLCIILSVALVYARKQRLGRIEVITLWLADGMVVILGAAILVGIVQRATHVKKY